jgi:calcium-dependent protein kinase
MRFYEFYSDETNFYLVTEYIYTYILFRYCEGGDLLAMMANQKSFTEKNASLIMRQILSAVEYCHKNKIVHRDLKPENCVFEREAIDSTIKVIDFGRSKMVEPKEQITDKAGSVKLNYKNY